MRQRDLNVIAVMLLAALAIPGFSQVLKGSRTQQDAREASSFRWSLNPELIRRLAANITPGPRISLPIQERPTAALIAAAKRQRGSPAASPTVGSTGQLLSPTTTTLLPASSPSVPGPEHTESATGVSRSPIGVSQPTQVRPGVSGSTAAKLGVAPRPLPCMQSGISDVNGVTGATTAIIFLEPGKKYVIHGCGFGNQQGQAYLTGVKYQNPLSSRSSPVHYSGIHPDWIGLLPAVGADPHQNQPWTDTEIQVVVDPNTSGFYDDYWDATVLVIPAGGKQQLQSVGGFGFWAARADQTLSSLPLPATSGSLNSKQPSTIANFTLSWFTPAAASDLEGHAVQANLLSPSAASLVLPGHTFAVVRDDNAAGFPGRQDALDLAPSLLNLTNGFQVSHIQLFTASLSPGLCPAGSNFSTNGSWNTAPGVQDQFTVSWQEQSCGNNGISAYALDVTVNGPRGVSPF